ncbi:ribonuclease H-like domain-containing protein [Tanacetum coccineum]|uniref:Ribonuclease H-like domain-containing protein n=1 Tax=Tanacetum coccineum TaxID=301880 RepID=A0ABQ5E4V5_9ASTR
MCSPCGHDIAYSFLAQPTTSPQLENEDFQQMNGDDLEELDLRWQVAMLTVRVKKLSATTITEKGILLENVDLEGIKGEDFWSQWQAAMQQQNESSSQALVAQDGLGGYDWSNDFEVEPIALRGVASIFLSSFQLCWTLQAAVDAMLPQIREQVREEYRTGAVTSGSNPPPVTIHTWLERFNKQKPHSFEKAVAPVDAENWISHMEKIFDVMDCNDAFKTRLAVYKFEGDALAWWKAYKQAKGGDAWVLTLTWAAFKELFFLQFFPRAEQERLKREYHSIRQRASENSTEYMQRFLRLAGFLGQAAGTAEEQAKNFRWGLHKSILDHVMCIQFTDVAQVADAARNLEILRDRDDYDRSERSDKRQGGGGKLTITNNKHNLLVTHNRNSGVGRDKEQSQQSQPDLQLGFPQSRAGHLLRDCKTKPLGLVRLVMLTEARRIWPCLCNFTRIRTPILQVPSRVLYLSSGCEVVLFDYGATHSGDITKRSSSTVDDKIRSVNALPLDMCEFDIILGIDWEKSMEVISALNARYTLLSNGCVRFSGSVNDTDFDVYYIHGLQPIVSEISGRISGKKLIELKGSVKGVVGARFIRTRYRHGVHRSVVKKKGGSMSISIDYLVIVFIDVILVFLMSIRRTREHIRTVLQQKVYYYGSGEALPLTKLMRKGEKFVWNEEREKSFEELKQRLVSAPILTLPSGSGGFQIYSDASKKGLGYVLMQHGKVIAYASRQLKPYELRRMCWRQVSDYDQQTEFRIDDDGILWQGTKLCIPEDPTLREALMTEAHSSLFSIHPVFNSVQQRCGQSEIHVSRLVSGKVYRKLGGTRKCRAPICWDQVGERILEGPEMIEVTNEKVAVAREKLKEAQTRQKSYADRHRRALEFQPGEHVFLSVPTSWRSGSFGIKGKLSPRYKYHPLHVVSYPFDQIREDLSYTEEPEYILDVRTDQMSAKDKTSLGYSTQLNELNRNHETDSENSFSVFDGKSSNEDSTSTNDRSSKAEGYKAVPPPITGNFLTPRADISFAGLDEYAIRNKIIESQTSELNTKTSETTGQTNDANTIKPKSASESVVSNPKINRDRVIIEDWTLDDEEEVSEVQTVRPETQTVKTRDDKSGQNSKKQGIGFRKVKACFVCKSTDHLIKDWRANQYGIIPKGTARPVSTARPSVSTARPSINTARPVNTASTSISTARPVYASRPMYPRMDNVRPRGSCSPIKRSYYTKPAFRPKDLKQDVKTFGVKNMTTAGTRAVVNTGKGKLNTDLKRTRWVWRPKGNYLDHVSKDSGSYMLKKGNPEILLQDHAVVDSGCSSHMTGNKAYLSDYEDFNGGFVAFGSDPKGGKITGKGKIKTANLDFDDVYFVDELKFNLFSVSQMCDKKNSVLFTESECLILSPSFKLLDESQVVLRAPRKDDVYSLDLKNIVPSGGITCLYANATADESKLWHRRLGHVNFKNINKLVKGHLVRGLPSKVFVNDHTCVACKKGKQHKASCKAKLERIIRKPLELLHMDLFGPVSVESYFYLSHFRQRLLICKSPSISFMRPFGCPLTILNTLDSLGKFDGKSDEGYLLGYSTSSKAFRVYNKRTKRVEENLHINFLEDQPNVTGTGPNWMGNQDVTPAAHEKPSESSPKDNDVQDSEDVADKEGQHQMTEDEQVLHDDLENMIAQEVIAKALDDVTRQAFEEEKRNIASQKRVAQATSTNKLSTVRSSVSTASTHTGANAGESSFVYLGGKIPIDASTLPNSDLPIDPNMPDLKDDSDAFSSDGIFK